MGIIFTCFGVDLDKVHQQTIKQDSTYYDSCQFSDNISNENTEEFQIRLYDDILEEHRIRNAYRYTTSD